MNPAGTAGPTTRATSRYIIWQQRKRMFTFIIDGDGGGGGEGARESAGGGRSLSLSARKRAAAVARKAEIEKGGTGQVA